MSDDALAALVTFAFLAALLAWVPLLEATRTFLAMVKRRRCIARLSAVTYMAELYR